MAWTCPHCNEIVEEPATGSIQFCLHCGMPAGPGEKTAVVMLETRQPLRTLMVVFGALWLVFFFIPFGEASWGTVMSWDLLEDREGMSFLVSWPLLLGIMFVVLGAVGPLPDWLRTSATVVLGIAFLVLLGAEEPGGPMGPEVRFAFQGGFAWVLLFPVVGAGLWLRSRSPRSVTARVLIGLGLLLGIAAYLAGADGESTLVGALLRGMATGPASAGVGRVVILLPMFLLLASMVGFRLPAGSDDPARHWSRILAWTWLVYLPAFLLLEGLMLASQSGYYFLLFLRLSVYTAGLIALVTVCGAWLASYVPARLVPMIRRSMSASDRSNGS